MDTWLLLQEIVYLLSACVVVGAIFSYLKQSPIVGYLVAGMFVGGPGSLRIVGSQARIETIAELGVALLLFGLGLEFSVAKLRTLGRAKMLGGVLQVVATVGVAATVVVALGHSGATAVTIGSMIALSSTAVVLRLLTARGELDSEFGRTSIAVLLVQDVALVPLAVLVTSLGEGGSPVDITLRVVQTLGLAVGLIVVLYVAITHIAMRFLKRLGAERNREFSVLLAVVIGLGSTALAHGIGLSPALGAFLAGMFLGSAPIALQFRADVASLRTVLLTLFFGAVGMVADPIWILDNLGRVIAVATAVIAGKAIVTWAALRTAGTRDQVAIAASLCLAQIGEFAFVIGTIGVTLGTLSEGQYNLLVSVSVASLLASPYLIRMAPHAGTVAAKLLGRRHDGPLEGAPRIHHDLVVIGFGPAGRESVRGLDVETASVCVIDLNEDSLLDADRAGFHTVLGDATQEEVLLHAGVDGAAIVVITPPSPSLCMTLLDLVRTMTPHAKTIVRARYARDVPALLQAGASEVASDEYEVGASLRALVSSLSNPRAP